MALGGNTVIAGLNLSLYREQVTAIIGPNGAGKTTLLRAILGLIPIHGSITMYDIQGRPTPGLRLGYVPQKIQFDPGAPVTVLDLMATLQQRRPLWLGHAGRARAAAAAALAQVGADAVIDRPVARLSGGQQQRVMLAMALLRDPELLLLDEPISGVDLAGEAMFCDLLARLRSERRMSIVMVSHDLSVVSRHATRVVCINRTLQCEGTTPDVMTTQNLQAIFGHEAGLYRHHATICHDPAGPGELPAAPAAANGNPAHEHRPGVPCASHAHAGPCGHPHHQHGSADGKGPRA